MNKRMFLLEVIIIIAAIGIYSYKVLLPEIRERFGSSDKLLNTSRYENLYYVHVDEVDFALVLDKNLVVYHLFFFNRNSVCLYNQNIENHDLEGALSSLVPILIENNLLKVNSIISVSYLDDFGLDHFKSSFSKVLGRYQIPDSVLYLHQTFDEIGLPFGISGDNVSNFLENMDYFSKEMARTYKENDFHLLSLDYDKAKDFSNRVYRKLEEYILKNEISNLERNSSLIDISKIPADDSLRYYPSSRSWFLVQEGEVYAFIEFVEDEKVYSFCYSGSIDFRRDGECEA